MARAFLPRVRTHAPRPRRRRARRVAEPPREVRPKHVRVDVRALPLGSDGIGWVFRVERDLSRF